METIPDTPLEQPHKDAPDEDAFDQARETITRIRSLCADMRDTSANLITAINEAEDSITAFVKALEEAELDG